MQQNGLFPAFSTALAPMHGLVTPRFMEVISDCGAPDEYIFGFLRVHSTSTIRWDANSLPLSPTFRGARNLSVQLLGRDPEHFVRAAAELKKCGVAAINLNFGCPMPKIRKKGVGGALLAELPIIDAIISALSGSVDLPISVKTRVGYESPREFGKIISILARHNLSRLYLHVRTVRGLYAEPVDFECVKISKASLRCPVIANGDIKTASMALATIAETGADGAMIGRAAVSNPWIFRQIRDMAAGKVAFVPSGSDYVNYVEKLKNFTIETAAGESKWVSSMKKYAVPIADFVDGSGDFPRQMRRATSISDLMEACEKFFTKKYEPTH
jgi:tRNA-dihydrouridine synthase